MGNEVVLLWDVAGWAERSILSVIDAAWIVAVPAMRFA
jgi:hypothetical protein